MNHTSTSLGSPRSFRSAESNSTLLTRFLLLSGIASSLLYIGADVVAASVYPGYSPMSQAVSELSALGAPSRALLLPVGVIYNILVIAFGVGVLRSAGTSRSLSTLAGLLIAFGIIGFSAPFTPMHMRGVQGTFTDTLHIAATMVDVLLMFLIIFLGAMSFRKSFRWYSIFTMIALLVFGALTIPDGQHIATGEPTPFLGLYERINIGVYMVWTIAFATMLWNSRRDNAR